MSAKKEETTARIRNRKLPKRRVHEKNQNQSFSSWFPKLSKDHSVQNLLLNIVTIIPPVSKIITKAFTVAFKKRCWDGDLYLRFLLVVALHY
jgi:hypothetical protein